MTDARLTVSQVLPPNYDVLTLNAVKAVHRKELTLELAARSYSSFPAMVFSHTVRDDPVNPGARVLETVLAEDPKAKWAGSIKEPPATVQRTTSRQEVFAQIKSELETWASELADRLLAETSGRLVLKMLQQRLALLEPPVDAVPEELHVDTKSSERTWVDWPQPMQRVNPKASNDLREHMLATLDDWERRLAAGVEAKAGRGIGWARIEEHHRLTNDYYNQVQRNRKPLDPVTHSRDIRAKAGAETLKKVARRKGK